MSYKVIIHRPGIERATAREAVMVAHTRLGTGVGESVIDAHATMLAQSGELEIVHAGVTAAIRLMG